MSKAFATPSSAASVKICQHANHAAERQRGERQCQQHHCGLRHDQHPPPIGSIRDHPPERRQHKDRYLGCETGDTKQDGGVGETIDQPGLRDHLHPGTDERDELAADEQSIVARPKCAQRMRELHVQ